MPPLQQEFHKGLPGIFQKLLINIDSASIIHMESSVLEISGMFQIDNYATTADEKAGVFFQRLSKCFEWLPRGKRFSCRSMNVDHVCKMFGIDDVLVKQTNVAAAYPHIHIFVREWESFKDLIY